MAEKNLNAVALGKLGGAVTGKAKARPDQLRQRWSDPAYRRKMSAALKRAWKKPRKGKKPGRPKNPTIETAASLLVKVKP